VVHVAMGVIAGPDGGEGNAACPGASVLMNGEAA
jgi:hypothetical protein